MKHFKIILDWIRWCPFLDLRISIINNHFKYQIYRKPTITDTIIPYSSNNPLNTKLSVFYSMFNRLENIPFTSEHYDHELSIIRKISDNNNYPRHMIDNIQKRIIYKKNSPPFIFHHPNTRKKL